MLVSLTPEFVARLVVHGFAGAPADALTAVGFDAANDVSNMLTGATARAGTHMVAPVVVRDAGALPGAPLLTRDHAQVTPDLSAAWAFCCHDHPELADGGWAYFYPLADLRAICYAGASPRVFDPITYGTGAVALLRHPAARPAVDPRALAAAEASFLRTRGPAAHASAAHLCDARLDGRVDVEIAGAADACGIMSTHDEIDCAFARVWAEVARLPRRPEFRMPDDGAADAHAQHALLPMGAPAGLCTEGAVVQSAAAWSLRRHPRVAAFLGRLGLVLDLPLVLSYAAPERDRFVQSAAPLLVFPGAPQNGVTRVGALCLGRGVLPVWTLAHGTAVPADLLEPLGDGQRVMQRAVVAFRADRGNWVAVGGRRELFDALTALELAAARVVFRVEGGAEIALDYMACGAGSAYVVDAATQPMVALPALTRQHARDVTLAVPLAVAHENLRAVAAGMLQRLAAGQCPELDIYGRNTRAFVLRERAEARRLAAMRPAGAPYSDAGADPWEWDPREQNPLEARPYFYAHAAPGLVARLNDAQ